MADIKAKTVSVAGGYKGTITADRVELLEGGRLWGTINVRTFLLDEGAHFDGQLVMHDRQILTLDEEQIRHEAARYGGELYRTGVEMWREVASR